MSFWASTKQCSKQKKAFESVFFTEFTNWTQQKSTCCKSEEKLSYSTQLSDQLENSEKIKVFCPITAEVDGVRRRLTFKIEDKAGKRKNDKLKYKKAKPKNTQKSWEKKEKISNWGIKKIFMK